MLMGGDYDRNSSQMHADSFKGILRQTILNQEVIFRKQVHELHRLYAIQKTLMKDCNRRELNGYKLGNPSTQSTVGPFPDQLRSETLATEKTHPRIFVVGSTQYVANNSIQVGKGIGSSLQTRPLDLQFSSSHCRNYIDRDFSEKGNHMNLMGKSYERNHYFDSDDIYGPEEVKLSLSIGRCITKKVIPSQNIIIDLEESTEMVSNEVSESISVKTYYDDGIVLLSRFSAPITSGRKHDDSQVPAQSSQNFTVTPVNRICKEWNSSNKDTFVGIYDDVQCDNMSTKGRVLNLDLNKVQLDESSFHSNDPTLAYPSAASSSGDAIPGLTDSNSNNNSSNLSAIIPKFKQENGNKTCSIDLESTSEPRSGLSEEPGSHSRNVDFRLNYQSENHKDIARPEVEKNGKVNENIDLENPCSSQSQTSIPDDPCLEIDILVQKAALSLVCFSLENPVIENDRGMKPGSNNIGANEKEQLPERSCDSYELMVRKLTETSSDDYCVSSIPFEVNEMDKREGVIKLRRGRRLKDFQKDVLPGLASLSRHEICEDINIMEGVMRSREYKRLRSKANKEEKWFTPVRSRRSRLNYVGRRYNS